MYRYPIVADSSWLKEHPPLNEQQLQALSITYKDFEVRQSSLVVGVSVVEVSEKSWVMDHMTTQSKTLLDYGYDRKIYEALKIVQPSAKREGFATIPDVTWDDIGALQTVREELQIAIMAPIRHPEKFKELGLTKAQGILLAGPPGCGKTLLAKYVGESERAVRQVFQRARNSSPCVIFFDELDALCPRRTDGGEGGSSVRVVNQLLTEMDGLEERKQVFIIGATNRPDIIDPAILRPGRLDKMLYVGLPTPEDRLDILMTITKKGTRPKLSTEVNLEEVASDSRCQGYSGADLAALIREASVCALKDVISCQSDEERPSLDLTKTHLEHAFTKVRPSVSSKDHQKYEKIKEKMT
ncbi:hypothetical protein KUTeg_013299 [Tegillarca granosa]|uniref:AAA+ ATPase domain-containing protein n=1 Tax=Tegillarca granosa TaxID=220873 RepID=A0ABQ9EXA0_TEGGR|nr:hypothetical protein KUTeg_013299 [Tegillarca granosa]